jgi:hypothetical protein
MAKAVRIGCALGYWGDRRDALRDLLRGGPLDYVMMDYLSEVTMSILQKQRQKNPELGYAHDFVPLMKMALPFLKQLGVKLVTNAGGLDPKACARQVLAVAREAGVPDLKIGVVSGDDLLPRLAELASSGIELNHMETQAPQSSIPGQIVSANAYLGAFPIAEALGRGADIVITGRVNDAALALGPLIHEFGWKAGDHDLLARGTIAGHLLECGGQASGGNFNGGWQDVPNLADLAFPIAEVEANGAFTVYIHPEQGGLVTPAVLKEQLLYEMTDPASYIVADVVCDITELEMEDLGQNRVRIRGIRGHAPTPHYKVSVTYEGRYKLALGLVYTWPDCIAKARAGAEVFLGRLKKLGIQYREVHTSILGYDGVHGAMARRIQDPDEVYLRMAFLIDDPETGEKIARELATHIVCGIPGACSLETGRPTPHKQIRHWPTLIPKSALKPEVSIEGATS